jgi:hypothetical protein
MDHEGGEWPWDHQDALITTWIESGVKSERQVVGEYLALYKEWFVELLCRLHLDCPEQRANFAIILHIARSARSEDQNIQRLLNNVLLRHAMARGHTDRQIHTEYPFLSLPIITSMRRLKNTVSPAEFELCLATPTYLYILQHVPLSVWHDFVLEFLRGEKAYTTFQPFQSNQLNDELPRPGYDLLYADHTRPERGFLFPGHTFRVP